MSLDVDSQSPNFATITDYLSWDHDRLDGILGDVVRMVDDGELERADDTYRGFRLGLARHIKLEEEIVFPAFEAATGITMGPTRVMRMEHEVIQSAMEGMRVALDVGSAPDFKRCLAELTRVMVEHNAKEERVLYPATDSALSAAERQIMLDRLLDS